MKKKWIFVSCLVFLGLVMVFAAWAGGKSEDIEQDEAMGREERVVLEFMTWADDQQIAGMKPMVDAMQKTYPNIALEWTPVPASGYEMKLKTRLMSGNSPEIINAATQAYFKKIVEADLIEPLNSYIEKDKDFDINKYPKKLMEAFTFNGLVMALPKDNVPIVLFYNKMLFDKAGIGYPNDNWTWKDLRNAANKLTGDIDGDGNIDNFGFNMRTKALAFDPTALNGYGAPGLANFNKGDKITLSDERNIEAFSFFQEIYNIDKSAPSPAANVNNIALFTSGNLAMLIEGSFVVPSIKSDLSIYGIAQVPKSVINGNRSTSLFTSGFAIGKESENKSAAWKAIRFMSYGEGNKILGSSGFGFPATSPAQYGDVFLTEELKSIGGDAFIKAMDYQIPWNWGPNESEISVVYQEVIDKILTSKDSPEKIIDGYIEEINNIFQKIK